MARPMPDLFPDRESDDPRTGTLVRYSDGTAFGSRHAPPALHGEPLLGLAVSAMEVRDLGVPLSAQLARGTLSLIRDLEAARAAAEDAESRLVLAQEITIRATQDARSAAAASGTRGTVRPGSWIARQIADARGARGFDSRSDALVALADLVLVWLDREAALRTDPTYDQVCAIDDAQVALAKAVR